MEDGFREYLLPYEWKKMCQRRKTGGTWDIYLISPNGKRFRSNVELEKFLANNPDVKIDREVTNCKRLRDLSSSNEKEPKKRKLEKESEKSPEKTEMSENV